MALNAQGYFNCLKSYLHHDDYGVQQPISGAVVLKEKIHKTQGERPKEFKVTLATEGEVIVIKLDGKKDRLFHFLDDTAKPWSKRCDFVIFNLTFMKRCSAPENERQLKACRRSKAEVVIPFEGSLTAKPNSTRLHSLVPRIAWHHFWVVDSAR